MSTHEIIALAGLAIIVILLVWIIIISRKASSLDVKLRHESVENSKKAEKLSRLIAELSALQMQKDKLDQHVQGLEKLRTDLASENDRLSKYRNIADADEKAARMLADAKSALQKMTSEAQAKADEIITAAQVIKDKATAEANELSAGSKQEARTLKSEAKLALDNANLRVAKIIEEANKRAEQIAGSAYDAMKKSDLYERTVKAMKNIIDGYGDQYIIPGRSLLDDLAEEYGFTEAGKELKSARERTKSMLRSGTAATCEYVEANRRNTAIAFVSDAFNGKVDSILSRVRHDNAGKLEQEIRDAFTLVNFNGKAFRDARITAEYLDSRLAELRWATVAHQLRLQEREEQRRIKEQLREEQKARREYERAIREAAKEETSLRKAMEKAQHMVEKATEEQRLKYEQQLRDLGLKLREAEERNQRAQSMAQQTRRGHVYIISNIGSFGENIYKIGLTRRLEPLDRVKELGDSSVPFSFDVHAMILHDDAPALETNLHKRFLLNQLNKVNFRKEFFRVTLKEIREEIERLGLNAKWTMAAEAMEYKESLSIERAIEDNPSAKEAWMNKQLELDPVDSGFFQEEDSTSVHSD